VGKRGKEGSGGGVRVGKQGGGGEREARKGGEVVMGEAEGKGDKGVDI
jgi:hypothetical protein